MVALLTMACGTQRVFAIPEAPAKGPTNPVDQALECIYNLQFRSAQQTLEAWLGHHPDDLRALNYLANATLDQQLFDAGLLSSDVYTNRGSVFRKKKVPLPKGFEKNFLGILDKAQALAEQRLKQNPRDEEALYWLGVTHSTRAEFEFTLQRSFFAALHEGMAARKSNLQLHKLELTNVDCLLVLGVSNYVLGSLPWYIKLLASIAGYHGNRQQGLEEVKKVSEKGHYAKVDAKIVLVALYRREKMYSQELADLQDLARSYPQNFLFEEETADVYKMQDDWQGAAKVYDSLVVRLRDHAPGSELMPPAKILYQAGQAHEHLGQLQQALQLFEEAGKLPHKDGEVYKAQLAAAGLYQRLNRPADARRAYQQVPRAVPVTEEGKAARRALRQLPDGKGE